MTMMARKRSPHLAGGYSREAAAKRIDFVDAATGAHPAHIGSYSLDPVVVARNVENFIGTAQVPIGIADPLLVNGVAGLGDRRRRVGRRPRAARPQSARVTRLQ